MVKPFQGTAARIVLDFVDDNPFEFVGYQSVTVPAEGDPTISITDPSHKSTCKSGTCDDDEVGGLNCADGKCVDVVKIARDKIAKRKREAADHSGAGQGSEAQQYKPDQKR